LQGHLTQSSQQAIETQDTSAEVIRELIVRTLSPDYKKNTSSITLEDFIKTKGNEFGVSSWFFVSQERVNAFADATGDHQWIHVDPERAKNESPFGGPIAHGFLTLSLFPLLVGEVMPQITGIKMGVNYGINKLRFVSPVPVGCKIRARVGLQDFQEVKGGGQSVLKVTIEKQDEGDEQVKTCIVAEWISRFYI